MFSVWCFILIFVIVICAILCCIIFCITGSTYLDNKESFNNNEIFRETSSEEESKAEKRIFLVNIERAKNPIITVALGDENEFLTTQHFHTIGYRHMKQIPKEEPKQERSYSKKIDTIYIYKFKK